jgi:hypothetical protein
MGDHKDPPAGSEHVTDDVGDGVCLTGTRRALNYDSIRLLQAANDLNLILKNGLGKKRSP